MMQGNEKWRSMPTATSPSARLRAARSMPQWLQARGSVLPPPPPPPPGEPPPVEPEYEVIEFPGQQTYTNTPIQRNLDGKPKSDGKRCDLCGSSAPAVRCTQCNQQTFCVSCDDMYHRHPKRQAHIRKELVDGAAGGRIVQSNRPPLPPKGESTPAPVPPPRRNKRFIAQRASPINQGEQAGKVGFVGSLKRMMNPRPLPLVPFSQDRQVPPISHSPMEFQEHVHPMHPSRQNGLSEWDMFKGPRSGSFSTLNGPGFAPMMQAHSMAQLNCPSCHHGVMWNEWGHGGPPVGPWGGMPPPGAWHSSAWLNQSMRKEPSHGGSSRRGSIRGGRHRGESGSSGSEEGERFSTRGGRRRNVSPALSRRSRPTIQSDYESEDEEDVEEEEEERGWRNPSKSIPHNTSPVDPRRMLRRASLSEGINRPYRHQDDDTLSSHGGRRFSSTMTRRGRDIFDDTTNHRIRRNEFDTMSNHSARRYDQEENHIPRAKKNDFEDNTSNRGGSYVEEFSSVRSQRGASDLEDSVSLSGRKKSDINGTRLRKENMDNAACRKRSKRHERFTDTGRRRSSPIDYRSDNRGEPSSDSIEENFLKDGQNKNGPTDSKNEMMGNQQTQGVQQANEEEELEKEEMGPLPDTEWDCVHCTFVNEPGTRVCAVCCKTTLKPKPHKPQEPQPKIQPKIKNYETFNLAEEVKKMAIEEPPIKERPKSPVNKKRGMQEKTELTNRTLTSTTSTGTSPPPQSISTQTYEETGHKLKRAASLADYDWKGPQRSHSRQSLLSDTQSLPVTPPKGRSPDRFSQSDVSSNPVNQPPPPQRKQSEQLGVNTMQRNVKRAGSQPPEYLSTLVQKQVKQGLEMVKLLREAEEHQFSADDLAVALTHCEDEDPVTWLQQNWRNMIDTVVTLATNYGHERKENTVGTISASEARDALRMHDGNVWAAVTECVDQRQKKYAELLSRGNFSREDIVTVLTAHHGNLEAAYTELNKSQLKPFLMRIWGPPQGADNESGDFTKLAHGENGGSGGKLFGEVSSYNSDIKNDRIHKWLENQFHKPNLSQSMMHLNLIGQVDTDDTISLKNLKPKLRPVNSFNNRRNSDVHRYLQSYYEANDNSLQINNKYASMVNLNKGLNGNEINTVEKNRVIEALKISNWNNEKNNNTEDYLSDAADSISKAGSSSMSNNKIDIITQNHITENVQNDYENVGTTNLDEEISNSKASTSSQCSSGQASNEDFINQIYALRQSFQLEIDSNSKDDEISANINLSSSESFESLGSRGRENVNKEQNVADEDRFIRNGAIDEENLQVDEERQVEIGQYEQLSDEKQNNSTEEQEENLTEVRLSLPKKIKKSTQSVKSKKNELNEYTIQINQVNINKSLVNNQPSDEKQVISEFQIDKNLNALKEQIAMIINGEENENLIFENNIQAVVKNGAGSSSSRESIQGNENIGKNSELTKIKDNNKYEIAENHLQKINNEEFMEVENIIEQVNNVIESENSNNKQELVTEEQKFIETQSESVFQNKSQMIEDRFSNEREFQEETEILEIIPNHQQSENLVIENKESDFEENGSRITEIVNTVVEDVVDLNKQEEINNMESKLNENTAKKNEMNLNLEREVERNINLNGTQESQLITEVKIEITDNELTQLNTEDKIRTVDMEVRESSDTINEIETIEGNHEVFVSGTSELPENSSNNSPVTIIQKKQDSEDKSHISPLTNISDGNSDKDISSLPTDSEKDVSSISEDNLLSDTKELVMDLVENPQLNQQQKNADNFKIPFLEGNPLNEENNNQLINLLKESLTKEDVVERIVSTLFQTVLRASVDIQTINEQVPKKTIIRQKQESETSSNFATMSESEETSDSVFYEAEDSDNNQKQIKGIQNIDIKSKGNRNKDNKKTPEEEENNVESVVIVEQTPTDEQINIGDKSNISENNLENVLGKKGEDEREIRRILAEGLVEAYDQAELAVQLMEMKFDEEHCLNAAKECTSLQTALTYLQQECHLCAGKYTMKQMVSMLECDHRCCIDCANNYFTLQITESSINDCVCPYCKEPDLSSLEEDQALEYLSNLDIFLKAIVSEKVHELFHRKLRDRTLMQDPNFKWCVRCSSGFIANPQQKRSICPDCKTITCATCGRPWEKEHEKMSCEEYAKWKEFNDPENQLARHLAENGVTCPKCNNRYVLAKGGCMHLTCPQCKYEFCSGCAKQFLMGSKCKVSEYCEKLGLHSHHPRNCLFYLRDKEPETLQKLLTDNGIDYSRNEENLSTRCRIQLLRETTDGLVEAICGYPVEGQGLCRTHYIEHLVNVVKIKKIDPAPALDVTEAQQELRRHGKTLPTRADGTSDRQYLDTCIKMILEEIPLE